MRVAAEMAGRKSRDLEEMENRVNHQFQKFSTGRKWLVATAFLATLAVVGVGLGVLVRKDEGSRNWSERVGLEVLRLTVGGGGERAAGQGGSAVPWEQLQPEYRDVAPLRNLATTAPVAELDRPAVGPDEVGRMARELGIEAPVEKTSEGFRVEGTRGALEVSFGVTRAWISWSSGGKSTGSPGSIGSAPGSGGVDGESPVEARPSGSEPGLVPRDLRFTGAYSFYQVPEVLSSRKPEAVARDLLQRLGLDTSNWTAEVSESGGGVVCSEPSPACEPTSAEVFEKTVVLRPVRDSYPTRGLDWQVLVGTDGQPTSLYGALASLKDKGEYPLRTTTEALEDLRAGKDVISGIRELRAAAEGQVAVELAPSEPSRPAAVEIADVRLTLEVLSKSDRSGDLLVPVYDFLDADGSAVASVAAVARDLVMVDIPRIQPLPEPAEAPATAP